MHTRIRIREFLPLAVAVIGGFVVGLPLLLIVLPAMMRRIYGKYR